MNLGFKVGGFRVGRFNHLPLRFNPPHNFFFPGHDLKLFRLTPGFRLCIRLCTFKRSTCLIAFRGLGLAREHDWRKSV